jgi:hypothetical protein
MRHRLLMTVAPLIARSEAAEIDLLLRQDATPTGRKLLSVHKGLEKSSILAAGNSVS